MKIDLKEQENLEGRITITIEKSDYEENYKNELNKLKNKVSLKGFRKGKVPSSALKKMYGQSVVADVVNNKLQEGIAKYIQDENIELLGNPIPADDQEDVNFDAFNLRDFTFNFDVGLTPKFDVVGVSGDDSYDEYSVNVAEATIDEELSIIRRRAGKNDEVDSQIEDNDLISLNAVELNSEDPLTSEFTVLVKDIPNEETKKKVLSLKKGDSFEFDINTIDKNSNEKQVRKYLLKLEDTDERTFGKDFKAEVTKVSRLTEAEMDEAFFNAAFGEGKVKNEDEARVEITKSLTRYYDEQAKHLNYREIMENLMEKNELELPKLFLRKWLIAMNEGVTDDNVDQQFDSFEKDLKWSIIRSNLLKKYDIKVEAEEIREKVKNKIAGYMMQYGNTPGLDLDMMTDRVLSDRKEAEKEYEELAMIKMYDHIRTIVTLTKNNVTEDEFKDKVKNLNANLAQ